MINFIKNLFKKKDNTIWYSTLDCLPIKRVEDRRSRIVMFRLVDGSCLKGYVYMNGLVDSYGFPECGFPDKRVSHWRELTKEEELNGR